MKSLDPRTARTNLGWAIFFLIFGNAISWSIGWGGRKDGSPGWEIERYFGWPATFYCDLWRSNDSREIPIGQFLPPYPIRPEPLRFVYCNISFTALFLDLTTIACGTALVWLWALAKTQGADPWMQPTAAALLAAFILLMLCGDWFSAHL